MKTFLIGAIFAALPLAGAHDGLIFKAGTYTD
jgi:hypothetical protein